MRTHGVPLYFGHVLSFFPNAVSRGHRKELNQAFHVVGSEPYVKWLSHSSLPKGVFRGGRTSAPSTRQT